MLKNKTLSVFIGMTAMILLLTGIYFLPEVKRRVDWRLDRAFTYIRVVLNPIEEMPTPIPVTTVPPTPTPVTTPENKETKPESVATPVPSVPTLTPTALPASASLPAPEYERESSNNCGPAALSIYLRYYQWEGNQDDIAGVLKTKSADRNVNVDELEYYVKNHAGWLHSQYRVGGDLDLLKTFLANGIPVLIEDAMTTGESYWPGDDGWVGHYLFLNGYNDATQTFVTQDVYFGPDMAVNYSTLEKNWQAFNHVYLLVYPSEKEETVKQILGDNWDEFKNRELALKTAEDSLRLEPENPFHWFNVGTNLVYLERYNEAAQAFDQARKIGLPQRMLRYQFGPFLAYFNSLRTNDLLALRRVYVKPGDSLGAFARKLSGWYLAFRAWKKR
jgi:tetratricopeptide (TPR) repeat protein